MTIEESKNVLMTTYEMRTLADDLILTGSITEIMNKIPAGSRPMTGSEKREARIKGPWDAYRTTDAKILKIKVIK